MKLDLDTLPYLFVPWLIGGIACVGVAVYMLAVR